MKTLSLLNQRLKGIVAEATLYYAALPYVPRFVRAERYKTRRERRRDGA